MPCQASGWAGHVSLRRLHRFWMSEPKPRRARSVHTHRSRGAARAPEGPLAQCGLLSLLPGTGHSALHPQTDSTRGTKPPGLPKEPQVCPDPQFSPHVCSWSFQRIPTPCPLPGTHDSMGDSGVPRPRPPAGPPLPEGQGLCQEASWLFTFLHNRSRGLAAAGAGRLARGHPWMVFH